MKARLVKELEEVSDFLNDLIIPMAQSVGVIGLDEYRRDAQRTSWKVKPSVHRYRVDAIFSLVSLCSSALENTEESAPEEDFVQIARWLEAAKLGSRFTQGYLSALSNSDEDIPELIRDAMREAKTTLAKTAASSRHTKNYAMKAEVFSWLDANFSVCKSMNDAAQMMMDKELVKATFTTVRGWVTEWKKQRSTGTP